MMELKFKKLHPDAITPKYATDGAACFDLHAIDGGFVGGTDPWNSSQPAVVFKTGLAFEVPEGSVMLIFSRSGHGFKSDIRLANCVGVIDSDYRGEVQVKLTSDGSERLVVKPGDRIAQAMIVPIPAVELVETDELSLTIRGNGGFGSTGA